MHPRSRGRRPRPLLVLATSLAFAVVAVRPARVGAAAVVNFDSLPSGTFLTNQLRPSHGVSFPNGVVVQADARARSAPNLGGLPLDGEFQCKEFDARFVEGQARVSVAFQASRDLGNLYEVTLTAYDSGNAVIDGASVRFTADSSWRVLTVDVASSGIRRAVLRGGRVGAPFVTNFLVVDDLEYTTVPPPPPPDTEPPYVVIVQPSPDAVLTSAVVPLEVQSGETGNAGLQTVGAVIVHAGTGGVVGRADFCGSPSSGPCPPNFIRLTIPVALEPALEGRHVATATACDAAGNCASATRSFTVDLSEPPPEVIVPTIEINQGVQPALFAIGRPGSSTNATSPVPLVAARDTAVRFYPLAVGANRPGYSARIHARVTYRDGSTRERFSMPNAGVGAVDVVADPGSPEARAQEYLRMRPTRGRTLNYVIPGELLQHATFLEVSLDDPTPVTGRLRVSLRPELRVAVKHLEVYGPGVGGSDYPPEAVWQNALRYVDETYPVSDVAVIPSVPARIADDSFCEVFSNDSGCAVWQFSFYDPPGAVPYSGHPTHLMKLGRIPYDTFPDINGIALWGSALSKGFGDTYAHEIGHTAGRPHAGAAHGEEGGEEWPFFHGRVGPLEFGVVTDLVEPPGTSDLGRFDLTVVDPCPGAEVTQRLPECALADGQATHDLLSYGSGAADVGPLRLSSNRNRWVSSYTWNRLYETISRSPELLTGARSPAGRGPSDANSEALLVDALLSEHGPAQALPILRLSVPPEALADPPAGPYSLELYGRGGELLLSRSFDAGEMHDAFPEGSGGGRAFLLGQIVPYLPAVQRVVVKKDGAPVLVRTGSAHAPEARVVYPNGGEVLASGVHTISWTVADADGDRVLSRVEYSSDGGLSWGTLGMAGSDEPTRLDVDVSQLPPSANGRFRVSASDGFHTTADASDCPVAVGVTRPAECGGPATLDVGVDVKPGAARDCVNPQAEGVVPAAVLGAPQLDATRVDPLSLVLAAIRVRLRGDGEPDCTLRDASGVLGRPDGIADLVCHFDNANGAWNAENGLAVLTGSLADGTPITGSERICRVPAAGRSITSRR